MKKILFALFSIFLSFSLIPKEKNNPSLKNENCINEVFFTAEKSSKNIIKRGSDNQDVEPCSSNITPCASTSGCVGGNIFEDFNCNGTDDMEPGVQGVRIQVYDCNNTLVGTSYSNSNGDWQVCGLTDGKAYRIEYILPEAVASWAVPTHVGTDNGSDIQFVTAPACTQFSVSSPNNYCDINPLVVTNCYVNGNQTTSNDVLVGIRYDENGGVQHIALDNQVGSTWGLAYRPNSSTLFAAAFLKRHTGFGTGKDGVLHTEDDISALYVVDYSNPTGTGGGSITAVIDLAEYGVNVGMNPRANSTPANDLTDIAAPSYDYDVFENVGRRGIGDIDISDDGNTLYIINVNEADPELIILDVSTPTSPTLIQKTSIPDPGCPGGDSFAPWALKVQKGEVYIGTVCTGDISLSDANLRAYVQKWNGAFSNIDLDNTSADDFIRLDYERTCLYYYEDLSICLEAEWQYWNNDKNKTVTEWENTRPQPILSDIEFADDGSMILGFIDRRAHQLGYNNYSPDYGEAKLVYAISGGELLYVCNSGTPANPSYTVEGNVSCSQGISPTYNGGATIPNRHFNTYSSADDPTNPVTHDGHGEISFGGVGVLPGSGQLVFTAMNPVDYFDTGAWSQSHYNSGGLRWLNTETGQTQANYILYDTDIGSSGAFGKAAGLGDVEFLCNPAPLEIGNYVWCDSLQNGIQDACERGISDIIVQLYDKNGLLVGQDTTVNGQYYFNESNVDTTGITVDGSGIASPATAWSGMSYSTQYFIVFGDGQFATDEFTVGSDAYGITSVVNAGSNDNIDSDVDGNALTSGSLGNRPDGLPYIDMTTAVIGCGDHKYDLGVTCCNSIKIGNRVWIDENQDGIQNPLEPELEGLFVRLFTNTGVSIAFTSTDANGEYLFEGVGSSDGAYWYNLDGMPDTADDGIQPNASYIIVFGEFGYWDENDSRITIENDEYIVTTYNAPGDNSQDEVDSDVDINNLTTAIGSIPANHPQISFTTDAATCENFTYDFGVKRVCNLTMNSVQRNCTEMSAGVFETTYDINLYWSNPPVSGGITLNLTGDGTLSTTTIDATTIANNSSITLTGVLSVPADGSGTTQVSASFDDDSACAASFSFKAPVPCSTDLGANTGAICTNSSGQIAGTAWEDLDCNGDMNEPNLTGVEGIEVNAYNCDGSLIGTTYTDINGNYRFNGLTDGEDYLIEFSLSESINCWAGPSHSGGSNRTTIQFVQPGGCANLGLNLLCSDNNVLQNGELIVTCAALVPSDPVMAVEDVRALNYSTSTQIPPMYTNVDWTVENIGNIYFAEADRKGNIYAPASSITRSRFVSTPQWRYGTLGGGTEDLGAAGTVYRMDALTGVPMVWAQLPQQEISLIRGNDNNADTYASPRLTGPGLGGIAYNEECNRIAVANMEDGKIYLFNASDSGPFPLTASDAIDIYDPLTADGGGAGFADFGERVFALEFYNERLYYTIHDYDTGSNTPRLIVRSVGINACSINDATDVLELNEELIYITGNDGAGHPVSGDIEINSNGLLAVGSFSTMRDGYYGSIFSKPSNAGDMYNHYAGNYVFEKTGGVWSRINLTTVGQELFAGSGINGTSTGGVSWNEYEGVTGSLANILWSSGGDLKEEDSKWGIVGYDINDLGNLTATQETASPFIQFLFNPLDQDPKGNGGDVDVYSCSPSPLEIGNYVWCDSLQNGIQDACERGIDDIIVQLYDRNGTLVGQDTTLNGKYYFNQFNVDTLGITLDGNGNATASATGFSGMSYSTQYFIVFGIGQFVTNEFTVGTETYGITPSTNTGSNDNIDSDVDASNLTSGLMGISDGLPYIDMTTTASGCGDHKYDMGVTCNAPVFSLGNQVFADADNSGDMNGLEMGIDGIQLTLLNADGSIYDSDPNTSGIQADTVITANGGYYRFDNLSTGNYIVEVIDDNFISNGVLEYYAISTGPNQEADPNNDMETNDNGLDIPVMGAIRSAVVRLEHPEPTGETNEPITYAVESTTGIAAEDTYSNLTVDFGFVPDCLLTITQNEQSACNDNGTDTNPNDDYFTIDINATALNGGTQFEVVQGAAPNGTGGTVLAISNYGTAVTVGTSTTFQADGTSSYNLTVRDADDNTCYQTFSTSPISPCSNSCILNLNSTSQGLCNNNDTNSVTTDDFFTLTINASAINGSSSNMFEVLLAGNVIGTGTYGNPITLGDGSNGPRGTFLADGSTSYLVTVRDLDDNSCSATFNTTPVEPCSERPRDEPDFEDPNNPCGTSPCHFTSGDIYLGSGVTDDNGSNSDLDASGDIDDGIGLSPKMDIVSGNVLNLPVTIYNNTTQDAYLRIWIDWNGNGDFEDAGENVIDNTYPATGGASTVVLPVTVPNNVTQDSNFALRARLSTDNTNTAGPCGTGTCADDGEIEDYLLRVSCSAGACLPIGVTITRN